MTRRGALVRRRWFWLLATAFVVAPGLQAASTATAALTPTITEFSAGLAGSPNLGIAPGPDGNVWFATSSSIGRITPAGSITEFSAGLNSGASPQDIAAGPDGNLWFTDQGTTKAIGRITPAGAITEFNAGPDSNLVGITAGPDGNLWFADQGATQAIGRITPAGAINEFSAGLTAGTYPNEITAGPDGNLWFASGGTPPAIGRVTTAGAITEFTAGLESTSPYGIAPGVDGNVWFSDSCSGPVIGRVTPAGVVTKFGGLNAGSCPYFIALGPDGSQWFTDEGTPISAIGRITPGGAINEFSSGLNPVLSPYGISAGPDGNVWFTETGAPSAIGRITTPPAVVTDAASVLGSGAADVKGTANGHSQPTSYRFEYGPTASYGSNGATVDSGSGSSDVSASSKLSGLKPGTTYHYRLSATNPTDTSVGVDATFTTLPLPTVGSVRVAPRTWRQGSQLPKISKRKRAPVGTRIRFTLSRAVPVRLQFFAKRSGRKAGKKCRRPTRKNRRGRKCTRLISSGVLSFSGRSGKNTVRFQGRVSRRKRLRPGRYQLKVIAADPTTTQVSVRSTGFSIVKR
jgi:streptogramin lyase